LYIPNIKIFRDKVAAHYAGSIYNQDDSNVDRKLSVFNQLSYCNGKFCIGGYIMSVNDENQTEKAFIPSWSLTEEHKNIYEIIKKYVPNDWKIIAPSEYIHEFI
jgi:hypothetical protein